MKPYDPISDHFRLVATQVSALKRLGLITIEDMLRHAPSRYDIAGNESTIAGLVAGTEATVVGTIHNLDTRRSWTRKVPIGEATIRDASGSIKVMWFHQPYIAKMITEGSSLKFQGKVTAGKKGLYLANPEYENVDEKALLKPIADNTDNTDRGDVLWTVLNTRQFFFIQ